MLDFNDLQFFAAVVRHGGFSAAARALGVPKSRLSRHVTALEDQLGVRLLERSTRHLALTGVGQQVFKHAQAVVVEAEAVKDVAELMQAEPRGLVRMSCPVGLQSTISDVLPVFLSKHPKLRVVVITTDRRIDLIHEGVDVAVRVRERLDTDADLQLRRVGLNRRFLVASPDLALRYSHLRQPSELAELPLLSQFEHPAPSTWNLTSQSGAVEVVTFEPRFASGSFELLLAAARFGLGVALLPAVLCRKDIEAEKLIRILPEWSGSDGILHVIFTSRRGMLPGVRVLVDFLADALKSATD